MASYQALRKRYSFLDLCLTPELSVEVTRQPLEAFDMDAAILFSDILLPLLAFDVLTIFRDEKGPLLIGPHWKTLSSPLDITSCLQEKIPGVYQSASLLSSTLHRPLIGFSGAPWTLAAYLIETESSKTWDQTKQAVAHDPQAVRKLLPMLEEMVVAHLTLQIQAGCSAIQIFDSHASALPPHLFHEFAVLPIQRIVRRLPPCPCIFFKVSSATASEYSSLAISCDDSVPLSLIRKEIPYPTAIQGNLSPRFLLGDKASLIQEIRRICDCMRNDKGFIFNLSGGVPPQTEEETIRLLVETIRERRPL